MKKLLIIFLVLFLASCAKKEPPRQPSKIIGGGLGYNEELIVNTLISQFNEWKSVPYRYGGLNKRGIDCSGLVQTLLLNGFDVSIPRTTILQSKIGAYVERDELRPGDLVFFKTRRRTRHVGLYLGKKKFIHSSRSVGVIISTLKNLYWSKRYWQGRRIQLTGKSKVLSY
ncbi:MAG: C40 family peptidase [Nitrospinae bacterium]|nr:C40 family peptidase [Nitrospinota bacterium]